jgi:hypothetical protein
MTKIVVALAFPLFFMTSVHLATAQVAVSAALEREAPAAPGLTHFVGLTRAAAVDYPEGVIVPSRVTLQPSKAIGARVRITTASTVEVVGLVRIDGRTITGRVLSGDADTLTTIGGADRPSVTVPRPSRRVVGTIAEIELQTLTITREDGSAVTVPRAAIERLEQQIGLRSRKRGAAFGFLIGGGAGAGMGFLIGSSCHSSKFLGCFLEPEASTFGGLILGGAAGAVLGAIAPRSERWKAVPMGWLDSQGVVQ